jgi:hypothetical protein
MVGADLVGPLPKTERGNVYIVSFVDYFSKWPEAVAIPDSKSKTVLRAFLDNVVYRFSPVKKLIADRGTCFTSSTFQDALKALGIECRLASPHHHQSNGLVERFQRVLMEHLKIVCDEDTKNWDDHIGAVLFYYRSIPNVSTGQTPAFMTYFRDLYLPVETRYNPRSVRESVDSILAKIPATMEDVWGKATERIEASQMEYKRHYDKKVNRSKITVQLYDLVWAKVDTAIDGKINSAKMEPTFKNLYRVVGVDGDNLTLRL